jgi:hydroxypyruvate reductase
VIRAAVDGVSARHAVARALVDPDLRPYLQLPLHVIAAGKAASAMAAALDRAATSSPLTIRTVLVIGTHRHEDLPPTVEWHESAHPIPDLRSVAAARRALDIARAVPSTECLLLLLSGGASALMAHPLDGLTLADKQATIREMMLAGANIHELNTVRKHLSAIKGGRLAAACAGTTLTLAISDVVGDDLSIIASGPGVPDPTTWSDVAGLLTRYPPTSHAVRDMVQRGVSGGIADTPKPGDAAFSRVRARVIASRRHALDAAGTAAAALGYEVRVLDEPVVGEARDAATHWFEQASGLHERNRKMCVLSAGETTVRVVGEGRGGRNQEFALALVDTLSHLREDVIVASVGTDGIDGPTDAAGALADTTSRPRAGTLGFEPAAFLADNNAYDFFAMLGDLIHLGRTDTNVGDVQVMLTSGDSTPRAF